MEGKVIEFPYLAFKALGGKLHGLLIQHAHNVLKRLALRTAVGGLTVSADRPLIVQRAGECGGRDQFGVAIGQQADQSPDIRHRIVRVSEDWHEDRKSLLIAAPGKKFDVIGQDVQQSVQLSLDLRLIQNPNGCAAQQLMQTFILRVIAAEQFQAVGHAP